MTTDATAPCENCRRMQARYEALEATVAQLQRQLAAARKDSSNSSKPPSSDIVKPKAPPPSGQRRKRGGQPGHTAHQRVPYPPEMLAAPPTDDRLDACPSCGGHLLVTETAEPIVAQRVEIVVAYLKGACHASFSTIRKFVRDVLGVTISRGQLSKSAWSRSSAWPT